MLKIQKSNDSDLINSCLDQSLVSSSWKKAESKACSLLSQKLNKEEMDKPDRQACMQLLGKEFVQKYYPEEQASVSRTTNTKKSEKSLQEMGSFIQNSLESASEGKGSKGKKNKFSELSTFSQEAKGIVDAEYKQRSKQLKKKNKEFSFDDDTVKLLSYDEDLVKYFCLELQKECTPIPDKLRLLLWADCVSSKEKSKHKSYENFQIGKKKFSQLLRRKSSSKYSTSDIREIVQKIYLETPSLKPHFSEDAVQFTARVVVLYSSHSKKNQDNCVFWAIPMQQLHFYKGTDNDGGDDNTTRGGNRGSDDNDDSEDDNDEDDADEENDDEDEENDDEDHVITVAVILEKTLRLFAPGVNQLFDMAAKVLELAENSDGEFVAHLKQKIVVNVPSGIKDFPSDILSTDKKRSLDMYQSLASDKQGSASTSENKIIQPEIFLRKWIYEGFVSILAPTALVYVWDQLFLNSWSSQSVQNVCLCLLGLLKPWFMVAVDYMQIRNVFLEEPCLLYTLDIKKAFYHVQKNGKFAEIPSMNRNIEQNVVHIPKREPTPPPPLPPPRAAFTPWVPYKKENAKAQLPAKTKVDHPFDLYVDSVRFTPDNATVVKISGKILNIYLDQRNKPIKIQGYPILDSPSRYPQFNVRETINNESLAVNPDVVIMFRVYTIEYHSKKQTIIGSCLFCPFSNKRGKQPMLRVGGHQIRVRYGIPDPDFTVEHMLASHMDNNPIIPGVTILIRVLPHGEDYIPAPEYESNVYRSELARPNGSEVRLYKYYQNSDGFQTQTVRDIATKLSETSSPNDDTLMRMMNQRFEQAGAEVTDFPFQRFVNYDKESGLMVLVDKAAGLPIFLEGRFMQCLAQSFPGQDTSIRGGKSQVKSFLTEELDLESTQRAPDWTDDPTRLNPDYDDRAYLLLTLYGVRPQYDPDARKLVGGKDGKEPRFGLQNSISWSVVPLFDKKPGISCY